MISISLNLELVKHNNNNNNKTDGPLNYLNDMMHISDFNVQKRVLNSSTMTMATGGKCPVSILHNSIVGRYRPVRVADGPITARYRSM